MITAVRDNNEYGTDSIIRELEEIRKLTLLQAKTVLTADDAALMLGTSRQAVYNMTSLRTIPHYRQGGRVFFKKAELEKWMTSQRVSTIEEQDIEAASYIVRSRV